MKKDTDFYKRMMEAKERKKKALEQKRLHDEFITQPESFMNIPIVVKSDAEIKMDVAFSELKNKLHKEHPTQQDRIEAAMQRLREQSSGL